MIALALVLAGMLQATAPAVSIITQPDWLTKPSGDDMARFYPKHAAALGLTGRAILACTVEASGLLTGCTAQDVSPPEEGFGEAALAMASTFSMKPQTLDGHPVEGGRVRIPIVFTPPGGPGRQLVPLLLCYGRVASQAEQNPIEVNKQEALRFWALQVMMAAGDAGFRPSAIEGQLRTAREIATAEAHSGGFRGVDADCDRTMKAALKPGG